MQGKGKTDLKMEDEHTGYVTVSGCQWGEPDRQTEQYEQSKDH